MKIGFLTLAFSFLLTARGSEQFDNRDLVTILSPKKIVTLLGSFPAPGSLEEAQDYAALLEFQETRTEEECAIAATEKKATPQNLFIQPNGPLSKEEAIILSPILLKAYADAGLNMYMAKEIYKRPRPYLTNKAIEPCIGLESSYAYPSGHTTIARVLAKVLAHVFPDRAADFIKRGDEISLNRVIGGVHFPSDVAAGKKLGDVLAQEIIKDLSRKGAFENI